MSLKAGQTLGQYKILDKLGAGGMGIVYKAQDTRLGRLVALKVLPPASADDADAVERFRREARTASSLNHSNICTVYSFDEQDGQLFLAMELLEGETLDARLSGQPLALSSLLDLGTQVADALENAHADGILHRDIKPGQHLCDATRTGQDSRLWPRQTEQQSARARPRRPAPDLHRLPRQRCCRRRIAPVRGDSREAGTPRGRHGGAHRVQQALCERHRLAASKLRLAELTLQSRQANREVTARAILSDISTSHPKTPQSLAALQMKLKLEQGRGPREMDPVLGVEVPRALPTLRTLTEQFPTSPFAMIALNRLAEIYADIGDFSRAAQTYKDLATSFPTNPNDAWFRAGEIDERRQKDVAQARDAYARVPEGTARYKDAQRRIK